jgi:hypothetical protein
VDSPGANVRHLQQQAAQSFFGSKGLISGSKGRILSQKTGKIGGLMLLIG